MNLPFFNSEQQKRNLDVTSVENALLDLLVRAEDSDLVQLGIHKGVMKLVSSEEQVKILANLGTLTSQVELGGSAANALRGMVLLGAKVSYSSAVGPDNEGKSFSMRLDELGILNRMAVVKGGATGTCLVLVTPDGDRTLNTCLGACREYVKSFLPLEDIAKSKVFFTTGYVWDTPNQIEAVEFAVQYAKEQNTKIALDLADPFVVSRHGDRFKDLMQRGMIDIVFCNADEANMMVDCIGEKAAQKLGRQVPIAVVKDGANGSYVSYLNQGITYTPAKKVNPIDTTGAGDMFAGGFLLGLCTNLTLQQSLFLATNLAAETITHLGVRLSPTAVEELRNYLKSLP